jgi:hypothetical protein
VMASMIWLLRIVGLNSTHIRGTHVPVEEPSTASTGDVQFHRLMIYLMTFGISGLLVSSDDATFDAAENIVHAPFHLNQLKTLDASCACGQEGADFETR